MNVKKISFLVFFCLVSSTALEARSYLQRAKYAFSMGKWKRAYALFEKSYELKPKDGVSLFYMAYIREQQNRKAESIPLYEKALELNLDKDLKEKCFWKITLYYKETREWESLLHYADEFLKFRKHRSIQKLKDLAQANHDPNRLSARAVFQKAREHKESGNYAQAAELMERALLLDPAHLRARFELALMKMRKGDHRLAAMHLEVLISNAPANWQYHYKAGVCYYRLREHKNSIKHLNKAQKLYTGDNDSFDFYVNYTLGRVYAQKEEYKRALPYLRKAHSLRQVNALDATLAQSYWHLGISQKAKRHAAKAVHKAPLQPLGHLVLAMHSYQLGKNKQAYAWAVKMNSVLKNYPLESSELAAYAPGFLLLAKQAISEEEWSEALLFFQQVEPSTLKKMRMSKKPQSLAKLASTFEYDMAEALMYTGNPQKALVYYQKSGKQPKSLFAQARCHALLFQAAQARRYLQKAVQAKAKLWEAAQNDEAFQNLREQDVEFDTFMRNELIQNDPRE